MVKITVQRLGEVRLEFSGHQLKRGSRKVDGYLCYRYGFDGDQRRLLGVTDGQLTYSGKRQGPKFETYIPFARELLLAWFETPEGVYEVAHYFTELREQRYRMALQHIFFTEQELKSAKARAREAKKMHRAAANARTKLWNKQIKQGVRLPNGDLVGNTGAAQPTA